MTDHRESHTHEESQDAHLQGKFQDIPAQNVDGSLGMNRKCREIILADVRRYINIPQHLREIKENGIKSGGSDHQHARLDQGAVQGFYILDQS